MLRAYHPYPLSANAGALTLDGAESRHLLKSLRAKEGEAVEVFDGKGRVWYGNCLSADQFGLRISVGRTVLHPKPDVSISLAQVLPKGGLFEDLIRTAAELGVSRVIPLLSERCEIKLTSDRAESKSERWSSIAVEGLKQSGNPWLVEISPVRKLAPWLPEALAGKALGIVASLQEDAQNIGATVPAGEPEVVLLVGPEGDFSPHEYSAVKSAGFMPKSFGSNVLRLESAATYGMVAVDLLFRKRTVS